MTTPVSTRRSGKIDWRAAVKAGIAYTASVFVFAFAIGAIRVTVVAPHLGALRAVVLEDRDFIEAFVESLRRGDAGMHCRAQL